MSKLINCKSCEKEVASSAKVCPHCGKKLKMGKMAKFGILIIIIIIAVVALSPSDDDIAKELTIIQNTQAARIDTANLAATYDWMGSSTALQKENKTKEIKGKVVQWTMTVFTVTAINAEKMIYKIQSSESSNMPGTFTRLYARNAAEVSRIEGLSTGSTITIKGKITDTTMGNIDIDLARFVD